MEHWKVIMETSSFRRYSLNIKINDASARYEGLPYGIDNFTADFESYIDLMRRNPSFLNLKILHFEGVHTKILADAKVEDLLIDPFITLHTESTVDLDALAKTFPFAGKCNYPR